MTHHRVLKSQRTVSMTSKLPASTALSPATVAATSRIRLNDPSLRLPMGDANQQLALGAASSGEVMKPLPQQHLSDDSAEKENSEPRRNSLDSNSSDVMEVDSTSNDDSEDSLAFSSSSDNGASPLTSAVNQPNIYEIEQRDVSMVDSGPSKRLNYNSNKEGDDTEELQAEDIDDDDTSECSGETVVANDFPDPPVDATEEEMNRYYWEVCYGDQAKSLMMQNTGKWLRSAPAKSCLSTKKPKNTTTSTSMTPRRLHQSPPDNLEFSEETTLSTPNDDENPLSSTAVSKKSHSAVKFGTNSAAEFDKLQPITEMTPMPSHVVQEIFPSESKEKPAEEEQVSRETARNVAMLAEWDDLFDEDLDQTPKRKRGRKRTPYKSKNRRPSKSRRDSSIFSKEEISRERSLCDDSDDEHMLPLSVTIDPLQYTSPSTIAASERDSLESVMETIETTQVNRDSLESSTSACISPNSMASAQTLSKETPKSARTSSSTILRAVHASGAGLSSNSPQAVQGNGLRPNQLNYSPGNSTMLSFDSSPACSDNQSLGSDIMSLFTQHTIDSDSNIDNFEQHLLVLSSQPLQMLHLRIGDMAQLMTALQKDPLTFLNENVLHNLTPATSLKLTTDLEQGPTLFSQLFTDDETNIRCIGSLESILQKELAIAFDKQNILRSFGKSEAATAIDCDETIASCVQASHEAATHEWSKIEFAIVEHSLNKLKEQAEDKDGEIISTAAPSKHKQCTQDELAKIKILEEELATETNRLVYYQQAQQTLRCSLEIERYNPITGLSEEIRKNTASCFELFEDSQTDYYFPLLDGSAEVTMNVDISSEDIKAMGLSIKDGGSAMKILQAIFLGRIDTAIDKVQYPVSIRDCVSSRVLSSENENLCDAFSKASTLLSRVDSFLKSVKRLESECLCTVDSQSNGNVHLAFSAHREGEVIKVDFVFASMLADDWAPTTFPSDVKVSIVSSECIRDKFCAQLQHKMHDMLHSASPIDPSLLNRIVNAAMLDVSEVNVS